MSDTDRAFSLPWDFRKFLSLCCDRNDTSSSLVLREGEKVRKDRKDVAPQRNFQKVLWCFEVWRSLLISTRDLGVHLTNHTEMFLTVMLFR